MDVFLVDAVRTPIVRRNGALSDVHAVDIAAVPLSALLQRNNLESSSVQKLWMGCATPIGEQGMNLARAAAMAAGWDDVAASTVDAGAASGLRALGDAWSSISSGINDLVVVGASASMTRVPAGVTAGVAVGKPFGPTVYGRYETGGGLVPPGLLAETLATDQGLQRTELDEYAFQSAQRCLVASQEAWWSQTIAPVTVPFRSRAKPETVVAVDEMLEPTTPLFVPADYVPSFLENGLMTAVNFASPADGSVAVMLASAGAVKRYGLSVKVRIVTVASMGSNPLCGSSGAAVLRAALNTVDAGPESVSALWVQEDSAATPLALRRDLPLLPEANLGGGVLLLGDPLGVGGLVTLILGANRTNGLTAVVGAGSLGQADCVLIQPV